MPVISDNYFTIIFKFAVGDKAIIVVPRGGCCTSSEYLKYLIASRYYLDFTNYYVLNDGSVHDEDSLFTEDEYEDYVALEIIARKDCARKKLE